MRVLHILQSIDPAFGGPIAALRGLALAQHRAGMDVQIVVGIRPNENLIVRDELAKAGVRIELIGPCSGPLCRHRDLRPKVTEAVAAADVVHIHAVWEEIQHVAAVAARKANKPHIIRPCGMLDPWCLNQGRLKKKLYMAWRLKPNLNRCTLMHFTSRTEWRLVQPLNLKSPAIIEPNGVDLSEFADMPAPGTFRNHYPQLQGKPLVLFLSRVHHKKGLDLLVPAFAKIKQKDAILVIAGPVQDNYDVQIKQMAEQHGIADRIIFTGMLRGVDRIAALADADLFVLPSYQENFGIVVVESLAAGTPVVISDQVNIHEEIVEAGVGESVPTQVAPLASAIERWLDDALRRGEAADKAAPFVQRMYDWNTIAARWLGRYEQLASGSLPDDVVAAHQS